MMAERALIVIFDALRPEFAVPELMPNLAAFAAGGVRYANARSTFPTETRVNQSAVLTGCMPRKHGVVGNKMLAADLDSLVLLNTGDNDVLADAQSKGPVLDMPSMGARLAAAGRSFASLSAGTPGGGRLLGLDIPADGLRMAMRAPDAAVPMDAFQEAEAIVGPMPDYSLPAIEWIRWAAEAYLSYVEPVHAPDVMILWLCEPDESFHYLGIGSPGSLETMRNADAVFGDLLRRLAPQIADGLQIIAMSDHGQLTITGAPLGLPGLLTEAGFPTSATSLQGDQNVIAVDTAGGIWVPGRDPGRIAALTDWLLKQPWAGPVFTKEGLPGTLAQSELWYDHARAPDVSLVLAADNAANQFGVEASSVHDAPYPIGGGCHGGLHPRELHTFLAMSGTRLRNGKVIDAPAGNIDVLPTVLKLFGITGTADLDGRPLSEAFTDGPNPDDLSPVTRTLQSDPVGGRRTCLSITEVSGTRYLNAGWRSSA